MTKLILLINAVLILPWLKITANIATADALSGSIAPLAFVGQTENKAFYAQDRYAPNNQTWFNGKAYCESINMTLAKVETEEERDLLLNAYSKPVPGFTGWHWTAARDSRTSSQFVWNGSNQTIGIDLPWVGPGYSDFLQPGKFLTCGVFYVTAAESGFAFVSCSRINGNVLCEAKLD